MNYEQALEYLRNLDLTPYQDPDLEAAIDRAISALCDCLELGFIGEE